ncbi:methyltransferase [Desulfovibrio sp. OttesenSCG-928-I05]|nr:methyltransferase [Desulfovibrio sp. OttesenSCG-928-I05]
MPDETARHASRGLVPEYALQEARRNFPGGLFQPEGSFRFSADALLLAAFAGAALSADPAVSTSQDNPGRPGALLDLGTGCGVVALAFLLRHPEFTAVGVDVSCELLGAARRNAANLGLAARFVAVRADLRDGIVWDQYAGDGMPAVRAGSFACVTANPPYRVEGTGRLPASAARRMALFGDAATLPSFVRAGADALAADGALCMVFPLDREESLTAAILNAGLFPRRARSVFFHERSAAKALPSPGDGLILLEAVKKAPARIVREEPLIMHAGHGADTRLTDEASAFCPWLGKGAERSGC